MLGTNLSTTDLPLLERDHELGALSTLLERAVSGCGDSLIIEGAPGLGKTRLLDSFCKQAGSKGFEVLRARGGELERGFAFGVVRQLFERRVASASPRERRRMLAGAAGQAGCLFPKPNSGPPDVRLDTSFTVLHGLYWLCANLALHRPLAVVVDDAHWSDDPSIQFLSFLMRRVEEIPVVLVVAARPREQGSTFPAGLAEGSSAHRVRLRALSTTAVHTLVRLGLSDEVESEFSDACHQVTGGNPFLVVELLRDMTAENLFGNREEIGRVLALTPSSVSASVLLRLSRLPRQAQELAVAVALLGEGTQLAHVAELSGLGESASQFVEVLVSADILRPEEPLDFIHPLLRASVYAEISASDRASGHLRAARVLLDADADSERIGAQLIRAPGAGNAWAVAALRRAGRQAQERGAPATAIEYLRRALDEPPGPEEDAEILYELGVAQAALEGPSGLEPFRRALELTTDRYRRAEIALEIGRMLAGVFYSKDATEACQQGLDALDDPDGKLALNLEVQLVAAGITDLGTVGQATERLGRARSRLGDVWRQDRGLAALTGCLLAASVAPARVGAELSRKALEDGLLLSESPELLIHANLALLWADELDAMSALCDKAADSARQRGSHIELCWALVHAARSAYRRGALAEAEADAREVLDLLDMHGWEPAKAYALAPLIDVLVERGEHDEAHRELEQRSFLGELGTAWANSELLYSRGRLLIAMGQVDEGLRDLRECGRRLELWGPIRNPECVAWRSSAALALEVLGEHAHATELVRDEVSLAESFGTTRALGHALCSAGMVEGGDEGTVLLRRAVSVLSGCPARLEHARALVELGSSLCRGGHRTEARDHLRAGLDLARRCDAIRLAERSRQELVRAGAKPRRDWVRGPDALTATEYRVAQMASKGMTNREIAQRMFVAQRTVETHLTHLYQKLGITSRGQLSEALDL